MKKNLSAKVCGVKSALWDKFLVIMRKSLILTIFLGHMAVFAYSQKVTINAKNQSVAAVLKTITRKTVIDKKAKRRSYPSNLSVNALYRNQPKRRNNSKRIKLITDNCLAHFSCARQNCDALSS